MGTDPDMKQPLNLLPLQDNLKYFLCEIQVKPSKVGEKFSTIWEVPKHLFHPVSQWDWHTHVSWAYILYK